MVGTSRSLERFQGRTCVKSKGAQQRWQAMALALVIGTGGITVIGGYSLPLQAQTVSLSSLTVQEQVGDQVYVGDEQVGVGGEVRPGQTVRTDNALTGVEFNTGAMGRLGRNSKWPSIAIVSN